MGIRLKIYFILFALGALLLAWLLFAPRAPDAPDYLEGVRSELVCVNPDCSYRVEFDPALVTQWQQQNFMLQRDDDPNTIYFKCPDCGTYTVKTVDHIPDSIQGGKENADETD